MLTCKYPSPEKLPIADVGIGGVVNFIVPELNDLYSGWVTKQPWRLNCHRLVENDKEVYLAILQIFVDYIKSERNFNENFLHTSFNEEFGGWSRKQNARLYSELDKLWH